jgi:Molecular chaperone GrpE (heat shock protein)
VDDWERALASLPASTESIEPSWIEGIKMIYDKLKGMLEVQGVTEITAKGEIFDPHLHEAVMRRDGDEGIVIDEIQRGYKLKDRVIRPSLVVVGEGKKDKEIIGNTDKEE